MLLLRNEKCKKLAFINLLKKNCKLYLIFVLKGVCLKKFLSIFYKSMIALMNMSLLIFGVILN